MCKHDIIISRLIWQSWKKKMDRVLKCYILVLTLTNMALQISHARNDVCALLRNRKRFFWRMQWCVIKIYDIRYLVKACIPCMAFGVIVTSELVGASDMRLLRQSRTSRKMCKRNSSDKKKKKLSGAGICQIFSRARPLGVKNALCDLPTGMRYSKKSDVSSSPFVVDRVENLWISFC